MQVSIPNVFQLQWDGLLSISMCRMRPCPGGRSHAGAFRMGKYLAFVSLELFGLASGHMLPRRLGRSSAAKAEQV